MAEQPKPKPAGSKNGTQDDQRDLGFGAVVSQASRQRLLNRDGTFNVKRVGMGTEFSSYHILLTMNSWEFAFLVTVSYFVINAIFAMAYMMCGPNALQGTEGTPGFARAFFFSVHTFATIGYGNIVPVGNAVNIVVTLESLVGLMGFALATGIMFARFSRPTANIVYSQKAVIAPYRDMTAFMFRVTNARANQIIELEVKVIFSRFEDRAGGRTRQFYNLNLERSKVAFFPLTWTVVHPIDADSPLNGLTDKELSESKGEFLVLFTGMDETFMETVHSRSSYLAEELEWNAKFRGIFVTEGEEVTVDLDHFHEIERITAPLESQSPASYSLKN
jgi:inward rectifier potassium channel